MKTVVKQNNPKAELVEDLSLRELFYKYLAYWKLFLVFLFIAPFLAYAYLRLKVPVYSVSASVLIKDEKKGIDQSSILEALDIFGSKKIVENEIKIFQSRTLTKQVINNLKLYAPFYEVGLIKNVSAYNLSPVKIEARHPENFGNAVRIDFSFDSVTRQVTVNGKKFTLGQWAVLDGDTLRFIPNDKYFPPVVKKPLFFKLVNSKAILEALSDQLSISSENKEATVIDLEIKDQSQGRGADILNELIRVYNKAALDDKNTLAANTLQFVEERLHSVVSELGDVEGSIEKYKTKQGIVDLSAQGQLFLTNVSANDQKIADIDVQLSVLDQVEKYVQSKSDKAGIVPTTLGVDDQVLNQLLKTLYDLQLSYENYKKTTGGGNPLLVSIHNQIEKVRPNILENIRNQRNGLMAGRSTLEANSGRYNTLLKNIPKNERHLLEISRQQAIKNNIYSYLLQKREETALSFASTVVDSRVIDVGESALSPVGPSDKSIYLLSLLSALVLGVVVATVKEGLKHTVSTRADVEKLTPWPVIGELTQDDSRKQIVVAEGQRNMITEQFGQIRTRLAYFGIDDAHKTILITSSVSGEGKSFVAANLALSLATTGKKVVLLELDLRKPKLSAIFEKKSDKGITNYIIGRCEIIDIIKTTSQAENLFFIPAGTIPPNPAELILNPKMDALFEFLKRAFDYIIIDTTPVVPVTDAEILSKYADATLFIVRQNYTPRAEMRKLGENVNISGLKNVTVVFNGVASSGKSGYGYSYAYTSPIEPKTKGALKKESQNK